MCLPIQENAHSLLFTCRLLRRYGEASPVFLSHNLHLNSTFQGQRVSSCLHMALGKQDITFFICQFHRQAAFFCLHLDYISSRLRFRVNLLEHGTTEQTITGTPLPGSMVGNVAYPGHTKTLLENTCVRKQENAAEQQCHNCAQNQNTANLFSPGASLSLSGAFFSARSTFSHSPGASPGISLHTPGTFLAAPGTSPHSPVTFLAALGFLPILFP